METVFESDVKNLGEQITRGFGLGSSNGRIFTTLYLEPKEISLEELSEKTGYSI